MVRVEIGDALKAILGQINGVEVADDEDRDVF